jgi:indolepyruvate ferredoxin oxidoreductase beta subunit
MIEYLKRNVDNLFIVDTEEACNKLGSSKVMNILMLGAAIKGGALGLTQEDVKQAIIDTLPQKFHELNFRALSYE